MKRSQIDEEIDRARNFFSEHRVSLPPWALYTPLDWELAFQNPAEVKAYREIREKGLGWDVTDFGSGNFDGEGLLLFTTRNGKPGTNRNYAGKTMLVKEGQITPFHFHWKKAEDIINLAGGNLVVELYNAHEEDTLQSGEAFRPGIVDRDREVNYLLDGGIWRSAEPGGRVILMPGQSITLLPRMYHTFYGQKKQGPVIVGEISSVNDDEGDNRFLENNPRFSPPEEDAPAKYVLCNEYGQFMPKE